MRKFMGCKCGKYRNTEEEEKSKTHKKKGKQKPLQACCSNELCPRGYPSPSGARCISTPRHLKAVIVFPDNDKY